MKLSNFKNSFNNLNTFDKTKTNQMRFTNQNKINFSGNINSLPGVFQGFFQKNHTMLSDKVIKRIAKLNRKNAPLVINFFKNYKPEEIVKIIDNAVGNYDKNTGYFTHLLQQANVTSLDKLSDYSYTEGIHEVLQAIPDVINTVSRKLFKYNVFPDRFAQKQNIKNINKAREMFEFYIDTIGENLRKNPTITKDELNTLFTDRVASEISNPVKQYSSRDERTINRIVTSLVSTVFSAHDFYNITMLQTDSTKEAEKAKNKRILQELSRLALSAGLTFVALGAFEKFTKASTARNVAVVATSQILADVISRVANGVHLRWLTPEEARKIALEEDKNTKNAKTTKTTQQSNNKQPSFQKSLKTTEQKLYQNFVGNSQQKSAVDILMDNIALEEKEKFNISAKKDEIEAKIREIIEDASKKIKQSPVVKAGVAAFVVSSLICILANGKTFENTSLSKIFKYLDGIKDKLTKTTVELDLNELKQKIEKLQNDASNSDEIKTLLSKYKEFVDELIAIGTNSSETAKIKHKVVMKDGLPKLTIKEDKKIAKGIYNGFAKIPRMFYDIFSVPGKLIVHHSDKRKTIDTGINKPEALFSFKKIYDKNMIEKPSDKYLKPRTLNESQRLAQTVRDIKDNTRNLKVSNQDTGDLASLSRAIITLVTSYFFIGDHRNKVLIESEGKDIEGANIEARTRGAHKLTNFIINGTLMNLANSILKPQLNSSLGWATVIPFCTEIINESLIRKCICQPMKKMKSKDEIIEYETTRMNKKGPVGLWTRFFKKITGKKSLTEKTKINKQA